MESYIQKYTIERAKAKNEFEKALLRIFRICDKDGDGFLSDNEFRSF